MDGLPGGHFNPLTFGPDGHVYTAVGTGAGYNTIQKFDGTTGAFLGTFMDNSDPDHKINGVRDIVFHPTNGYVYVASAYTDEVLRYDAQTGDFVDVFVSANSGGIDHPDGMMFGPDSNGDGHPELYVTGWLSHSVVRYDGATGSPLGNYVSAGSGGLSFPFSLAFRAGDLYVTSAGTNEILKYDAGSGSFLGVAASGDGLDYPRGLTFGSDDLLYVTSGDNDRIMRFTPSGAYVDDYVPAGTGGLDDPRTPRFGPDGNLYVTVTGKNEIMRFGTENEAVFTVSLSTPSSLPLTVDFTTADLTPSPEAVAGSDYAATSGTLTFEPGITTRTILVPIVGDSLGESSERFWVNLLLATGATILDGEGIATIVDDDTSNDPNTLYVYDIDFDSRRKGKQHRIVVDVNRDSNADGLASDADASAAGVTVVVEVRNSADEYVGTYSGTTDSNGIFRSGWITLDPGTYKVEVIDLIHPTYAWDLYGVLDPTSNDLDWDEDGLPDDELLVV